MSGQRKIFELRVVLMKAYTGRLRRIGAEVIIEIGIDQFLKVTRLGAGGEVKKKNHSDTNGPMFRGDSNCHERSLTRSAVAAKVTTCCYDCLNELRSNDRGQYHSRERIG